MGLLSKPKETMSLELLQVLNDGNHGVFDDYLQRLRKEPRIAWYPSAGRDFRDLLYLSKAYSDLNPVDQDLPPDLPPPDLFLHTDYSQNPILKPGVILEDKKTKISVLEIEELQCLDLPLDPGIVVFPKRDSMSGRMAFAWVQVVSDKLPESCLPVLYLTVENSVFCANLALKYKARFSHIVRVLYGGGCGGGGYSQGEWINGVLRRLGCQVLVTDPTVGDGHRHIQNVERSVEIFPILTPEQPPCSFITIRTIPGRLWSEYGNVSWKLVC
jgi:hypothetical protein